MFSGGKGGNYLLTVEAVGGADHDPINAGIIDRRLHILCVKRFFDVPRFDRFAGDLHIRIKDRDDLHIAAAVFEQIANDVLGTVSKSENCNFDLFSHNKNFLCKNKKSASVVHIKYT